MNTASLLDVLAEEHVLPDGYDSWAIKTVRADFRTRNNYRWPFPGSETEYLPLDADNGSSCPARVGDGICVATTWAGMASGGIPAHTLLLVAYRSSEAVSDDPGKLRVPQAFVVDVVDGGRLVRECGAGKNLAGADLYGANLRFADLTRVDLTDANLYGANLEGADLRDADLTAADLTRAYLYGADLRDADLTAADLTRANLYGANLAGADLTAADLTRANLYGANLAGADLTRVDLTDANLYGANLEGANLYGANLPERHTQTEGAKTSDL